MVRNMSALKGNVTLTETIDDIDIPTRLEIFNIHGGKIQTRDFVCFSPLPLFIGPPPCAGVLFLGERDAA